MPTFAKTHDECRKSVCIICMKKVDQELSVFYIEKIHQYIQKDVNFQDDRVPFATSITCRSQLGKLDEIL